MKTFAYNFTKRFINEAPYVKYFKTLTNTMLFFYSKGWDVNEASKDGINPEVLISLTVPKKCATQFSGKHFLAGRFLPYDMQKKYELNLPEFPGTDCFIEL